MQSNEIDVWRISLDTPLADQSVLHRCLDEDERDRAQRFHFDRDRRRFEMGRAAIRCVLSRYAGCRPSRIRYDYSRRGKPSIAGSRGSELHFSASRSGSVQLLAVSRAARIGADIEWMDPEIDAEPLAQDHFSEREYRSLRAVEAGRRLRAFYAIWTRKEAFSKALGLGLSLPLHEYSVTADPDASPALLEPVSLAASWSLANIDCGRCHVAAIAVEQPMACVRQVTSASVTDVICPGIG